MSSILSFYLDTLCPVFFVLALGFYAGWRGRIGNRDTSAINTLLMHFALPCSLFLGVARTSLAVVRSQLPLVLVLTMAMLAVYALTFFLQWKRLGSSRREAAVQALTVSFPNNVAVGLPLLSALFGPAGLLAVAAAIVCGALAVSPLTLVLLEYDTAAAHRSVAARLLPCIGASLRRPVVFAPLLALLFPLAGLTLPRAAIASTDLIGKGTVGLALFLTGLILSACRPHLSLAVLLGVFLKNLLQPALAALLLVLFHVHGALAQETLLLAAVPAGFFGTVFAARYDLPARDTSNTLLWSTFACAATLPAAILLSRHFA